MSTLPLSRLADLKMEIETATQPSSVTERWLASQMSYASWELERVRTNQSNTAVEHDLNAAYSRAARNLARARKELLNVQTARVNHVARLSPTRRQSAAATPMADPARAPQPKLARPMVDHLWQLIAEGVITSEALRLPARQEAR